VRQPPKPPAKKPTPCRDCYKPVYLALALGGSSYGSITFDNRNGNVSGVAVNFGFDVAYFFNKVGVGFKVNMAGCNVEFSNNGMSYYDMTIFYGPSLYGRFGKGKLAFIGSAGVGGLSWSMSDRFENGNGYNDVSKTSVGLFLSAGANYMFSSHVGLNLQLQSMIGSMENAEAKIKRKPTGIGATLGINFRF
jgi:hypothetical protein